MSSPAHTAAPDYFLDTIKIYLAHLRDEILRAQQTRMQVQSAKIIFLGGVYTYALKENDLLLVLTVPFVAFAFDCVIYGFTYNIYEIGTYIRDYVEPMLPQPTNTQLESVGLRPPFLYWETAKSKTTYRNWGRAFSRIGNYGVTILACITAFIIVWSKVRHTTWALLIVFAIFFYGLLAWFECKGRQLPGMKPGH